MYGVSKGTVHSYLVYEKVKLREYTEAVRVYEVNDDYFNEINEEKSFELGVLFSKATLHSVNTSKFIEIACMDNQLSQVEEVVSKFTNKPLVKSRGNTYVLRVSSNKIYEKLVKLGMKKSFPTEKQVDLKSFYSGFFSTQSSFHKGGLYIASSPYNEDVKKYLSSIGAKMTNSRIILMGSKRSINIFLKEQPIIKELILKNINEENKEFWSKFI